MTETVREVPLSLQVRFQQMFHIGYIIILAEKQASDELCNRQARVKKSERMDERESKMIKKNRLIKKLGDRQIDK